ncbi:MAG: gamma-glutamyl-gamma-aminobutyrate hydrolase family protein [candidate division Zixibacteria bacterium]|nr:gamma-glutamyl-gamma-aminobutyrate hydrolase family protein [candidate division Zixibacteria bacterium]
MSKPIIGITCSMEYEDKKRKYPTAYAFDYIKRSYYEVVEKSGGVPVVLPNTKRTELVDRFSNIVDGLIISGGNDVDPVFYGERRKAKNLNITRERDLFEIALVRKAKAKRVPILAICRGMQLVNVALGGSLYQDFSFEEKFFDHTLEGSALYHKKHPVIIQKESKLFCIIGRRKIMVNTSHHQMVKKVAPKFIATAWSEKDGVVEAIELEDDNFLLCVQWHPELMKDRSSKALFDSLIQSALRRAQDGEQSRTVRKYKSKKSGN